MTDINLQYELRHVRAIAAIQRRILDLYKKSILEISLKTNSISLKNQLFKLSDYPLLNKQVEAIQKKMHQSIFTVIVNGINTGWDLSNEKNNIIVDRRLAGNRIKKKVRQLLYDPNIAARESFIKRKESGLNLSDRVWNAVHPFRNELEQAIGLGISHGQSGITLAMQIQKYLKEPDRLFRRVRGEDGKLSLSQAARNYHPGQGVYRSSFQNSIRLTGTETNMAYRSSDWTRWQTMPFVIGIEIKLSKNHPRYDICDVVQGRYPKTFKWMGWHPRCICYQVPVMMNENQYDRFEDDILAGRPIETNVPGQITDPPKGFFDWLKKHGEQMKNWKNEPYWMRDNPDIITPQEDKFSVNEDLIQKISNDELYRSELFYAQRAIDRFNNDDADDSWDLSGMAQYGLSDAQTKLVYAYTAAAYRQLNRELFTGKASKETLLYEKGLNAVLDKLPTFNGDVIRFYQREEGAPTARQLLDAYKNSEVILFNGFLSTSKDPEFTWESQLTFYIKSKTGRIVKHLSAHEHEDEVLFKSKTAFKVVQIDGTDIYLEELDD
jgi:hypothetical protein